MLSAAFVTGALKVNTLHQIYLKRIYFSFHINCVGIVLSSFVCLVNTVSLFPEYSLDLFCLAYKYPVYHSCQLLSHIGNLTPFDVFLFLNYCFLLHSAMVKTLSLNLKATNM